VQHSLICFDIAQPQRVRQHQEAAVEHIPTRYWLLAKHTVYYIGVTLDLSDIDRYLFYYSNLSENTYPVNVDKLSKKSYKELNEIVNIAIIKFNLSIATMHLRRIGMIYAQVRSTDNWVRGSPIRYRSTRWPEGFHRSDQFISYYLLVPHLPWFLNVRNIANLFLHMPRSSFGLWEWS
jgi:hypothetical protein